MDLTAVGSSFVIRKKKSLPLTDLRGASMTPIGRVAYLKFMSFPEYGAIDVGGESSERLSSRADGFVTPGAGLVSIKCAQDGLARVLLVIEEWRSAPSAVPPEWMEREAEFFHEIEIDEYLTVAPAGTQGADLRGFRLQGGCGSYGVHIRAQGRAEVKQRITDLSRRGRLDDVNELDGMERYLIQIWPSV